MKLSYSAEAVADLADIMELGEARFGEKRSKEYAGRLRDVVDLVARYPKLGRARQIGGRWVRVHPIESHLIVYEIHTDRIQVVRLLHGRQDIAEHI